MQGTQAKVKQGQTDVVTSDLVNGKKWDQESKRIESREVSNSSNKTCSGDCNGNGMETWMIKYKGSGIVRT